MKARNLYTLAVLGLLTAALATPCLADPPPDGPLWSWGTNSHGALGIGTASPSLRLYPMYVNNVHVNDIMAVDGGTQWGLALDASGSLWSWGYNEYGQLGNATTTDTNAPGLVKVWDPVAEEFVNIGGIKAIAANLYMGLAADGNGDVWAWGLNNYGLGDGTTTSSSSCIHVSINAEIVAVATGGSHCLALDDEGKVWAWGRNDHGQLGDGTNQNRSSPVPVKTTSGGPQLTNVVSIAAGLGFSLVAMSDGSVWAWGWQANMVLGDRTLGDQWYPVEVKDNQNPRQSFDDVIAVACGNYHAVAISANNGGHVWTWGDNTKGQLGNANSPFDSDVPVDLEVSENDIVRVAACAGHTMVLDSSGRAWGWGHNGRGQVGNNSGGDVYNEAYEDEPVQVLGPDASTQLSGIVTIGVGGDNSLAAGGLQLSSNWLAEEGYTINWVYQNTPVATQDKHKTTLAITVQDDTNNNDTYSVLQVSHDGGEDDMSVDTDDLDVEFTGGRRGVGTTGVRNLEIIVQGDDDGGFGVINTTLELVLLGDTDRNGTVDGYWEFPYPPSDLRNMIFKLNGMPPAGIPSRAYDLDCNGGAEPTDLSLLTNIINGVPVP